MAAVAVKGLAELNRAFNKIDSDLPHDLRATLRKVGEPVRAHAEKLAHTQISRNTDRWSEMRLGVTTRSVYIAPRARRRGGSGRPTFGAMLLTEAMIPALDERQADVVRGLEGMLDELGRRNGF